MKKKCKVIMIPTNERVENCIIKVNPHNGRGRAILEYTAGYLTQEYLKHINSVGQHLYIISDDEIKVGDWITDIKNIYKAPDVDGFIGLYKIIATTDPSLTASFGQSEEGFGKMKDGLPQPTDCFVKRYVEEYNKGTPIENVMVVYVQSSDSFYGNKCPIESKINSDNTIDVQPTKDRWTRDEVKQLCWQAYIDHLCIDGKIKPSLAAGFLGSFNKWVEENL